MMDTDGRSLGKGPECDFLTPKAKSKALPQCTSPSPISLLRHHGRNGLTRQCLGHRVTWSSQTTMTPAIVRVYYHYLAGRYRDLSNENGLGLHSDSSVDPFDSSISSSSKVTVNEVERYSNDGSTDTEHGNASDSLRAVFKSDGMSNSVNPEQISFSRRGGTSKRVEAAIKAIESDIHDFKDGSGADDGETARSHEIRHDSLGAHTKVKNKASETMKDRIQKVTDIGRLKWEAKAAMLNNSFSLAILLYTRAATLGSISACLSLSKIYCTGVTRGNQSMTVLFHRDPPKSLSWALEAAIKLRHREMIKAKRRIKYDEMSGLNQAEQIMALFARLLRCKEIEMNASDDIKLPRVIERDESQNESHEPRSAWQKICESTRWLESQLNQDFHRQYRKDKSVGPDDEEEKTAAQSSFIQVQIALVSALVATRIWVTNSSKSSFVSMQRCWEIFVDRTQINYGNSSADLENIAELVNWCRMIQKMKCNEVRESIDQLREILDESLSESSVPVAGVSVQALASKGKTDKIADSGIIFDALDVSSTSKRPNDTVDSVNTGKTSGPFVQRALSSSALDQIHHKRQGSFRHDEESIGYTRKDALQRRSSTTSDSPSLLYAHGKIATDESLNNRFDCNRVPSSSSSKSLWKEMTTNHQIHKGKDLHRVASLYSTPSIASLNNVYIEASTAADYDVDISVRRQQARRNRGDSNASVSTFATNLSSCPSICPSIADSEYAAGYLSIPSTSRKNYTLESHCSGAADSLRRIGEKFGVPSRDSLMDDQATPHLTDTVEQLIANSRIYQAVARSFHSSHRASGKPSFASMRSLTAFTSNDSRQDSLGLLKSQTLHQGTPNGRAYSVLNMTTSLRPSISKSTSFLDCSTVIRDEKVKVVMMPVKNSDNSDSALENLRLLGIKNSTSSARRPIPTSFRINTTNQPLDKGEYHEEYLPSKDNQKIERDLNYNRRSFYSTDPTHTISRETGLNRQVSSAASRSSANSLKGDDLNHRRGDLDPALAEAEEKSGLKTTSICFICNLKVVNAPVSKSGEIYCSRSCRLERKRQKAGIAGIVDVVKGRNEQDYNRRLGGVEV